MKLNVSEIFYSLQGEGHRAGTPTIFIRLQGCKAKHACFKSGIKCDTEFESGREYTIPQLLDEINEFPANEITWTGGEPLDQLNNDILTEINMHGLFYHTVETSGLHPCPSLIDFVVVSPKVAEHVIKKNFPKGVDELRYVRHKGQSIPSPSIDAKHYFISPHSDGFDINGENVAHCIKLCKDNPKWRLSVQQHKIWNVL